MASNVPLPLRSTIRRKTCPSCAQASPPLNLFCTACGASLVDIPEEIVMQQAPAPPPALPDYLIRPPGRKRRYDDETAGTGVVWLGLLLVLVPAATANFSPLSLAAWGAGIVMVLAGIWRTQIDRQAMMRAGFATAAFAAISLAVIGYQVFGETGESHSSPADAPISAVAGSEQNEITESTPASGDSLAISGSVNMARGAADQTGEFVGPAPVGNPYRLWRYDAGDNLQSAPVVRGDTAYIGTSDGFLVALDLTTGRSRWNSDLGGYPVRSAPAIGDRMVYVGSGYSLIALDVERGVERWRFTTGYTGEASPTVVNGTVYIASKENFLYAVDTATGERKWSVKTEGLLFGSASVGEELLVIAGDDGDVFGIEVDTGRTAWKITADDGIYSTPAIVGDTVYVTTSGRTVLALDLTSGEERWSYPVGGDASPAIAGNSLVVGATDGGIYAFDPESGGPPSWLFATGSDRVQSPAISGDRVIVAAGQTLFSLDRVTGTEVWRYPVGDVVTTDPVVLDGVVLIGTRDGHLYAIAGDGTVATPVSPVTPGASGG